ncbi:MAG: type II toxin-antitoxin system HicB family antitoxin [Prochlorotrichaceae cyanobacterium]|jgi:predicted HicB family RNase H-like nuclease
MSALLKYKDYSGLLEVDTDENILFGTVIDIDDVITFQGETIEEARQAFQDSVEEYLTFCAELGRNPEKPFSGKLQLRTNPELHRKLFLIAKREGVSINTWIENTLDREVRKAI